MGRYATEAERLRAHREAFLLALELGCTPKQAEDELRKRRAMAREAESLARMAAKDAPRGPVAVRGQDEPWMMRD